MLLVALRLGLAPPPAVLTAVLIGSEVERDGRAEVAQGRVLLVELRLDQQLHGGRHLR